MRRTTQTGLVTLLVIAMLALFAPAQALAADAGLESDFVAKVNAERSARGLTKLSVASDLVSAARAHSKQMADEHNLYHNPELGTDVGGWKKLGENVGKGPSVSSIHTAFMNSSGHKRNILDSDWTQVGIGVVVDSAGTIWVTEIFRLPSGAAPAPEPKPEPTPEPKPAPEPEPEPEPAPKPAPARDATPTSKPAPAPAPEPEAAPQPVSELTMPALADVMLEVIG